MTVGAGQVISIDRVDLAHESEFTLGALSVVPGLREVRHAGGACEVLEPRVMQVLVALARADGATLTRDDLTQACWEGRVVGEDAINRVMSRLRRVAEGLGSGSFRLETITKVGYRLIRDDAQAAASAPSSAATTGPVSHPSRRWLIGGGITVAGLSAIGIGNLIGERGDQVTAPPVYPADVAPLLEMASFELRTGTTEGTIQAIGFLRQVTARRPELADGWGMLAMAYAISARTGPSEQVTPMLARSQAAAAQALKIESDNGYAVAAAAYRQPMRGHWLAMERDLRAAIERRPNSAVLRSMLGGLLGSVGRVNEQVETFPARVDRPTPVSMYVRAQVLWAANRLEEADRAIEEAFSLFPLHFGVWFVRFYLLMYTGRMDQAIAMGEDRAGRPVGIPEENFDGILAVARAMISRTPAAIDAVVAEQRRFAMTGSGFAQNAVQFLSVLGRLDDCFAILEGYFFDRGLRIPDARFPGQQRTFTRLEDRHTYHLFNPPLAAARADPRFDRMTAELGLERYWAESGTRPDYRRTS